MQWAIPVICLWQGSVRSRNSQIPVFAPKAAPSYPGPYLGKRRARLALPARLAQRGGRCLRIPRALCALRSCAAAVTCCTVARGLLCSLRPLTMPAGPRWSCRRAQHDTTQT